MRKLVGLMVMVAVFVAIVPVSAQDGLSDEEIALIDRVIAAGDARDDYDSYEFSTVEENSLNMTMNIQGQELLFNQSHTVTTDGYHLSVDDIDHAHANSELVFAALNPNGPTNYTATAEIINLDDVLYVNASLVDGSNPDGDIPEGWLTIESADDIPVALENFGFADLFDEEDEDDSLADGERFIDYASSVTLEESELQDGTPVEIITILIEGEGVVQFYDDIFAEDESDDPIIDAFLTGTIGGNVIVSATLNADDTMLSGTITMNMIIDGADLSDVEDLPEGTTMTMIITSSEITEYSNFDGDLPAIEAPTE